jgi:hypothetical protein
MPQLYDTIGMGYGSYRRPDPRIAESSVLPQPPAGTRHGWRATRSEGASPPPSRDGGPA